MKNFKKFLLASCYVLGTFGIEMGMVTKCNNYIDNNYEDDSKIKRFCNYYGIVTEHMILLMAMFEALHKLSRKMIK